MNVRELEKKLRERGYSRRVAVRLASQNKGKAWLADINFELFIKVMKNDTSRSADH